MIIEKVIFISCYGPQVKCIVLFSTDFRSSESVERSLKDFLGKCIDLKDKPHTSKEQLSIMDSGTLSHI